MRTTRRATTITTIVAACAIALTLTGCTPAQSSVTVNGRTLLLHGSGGGSADALAHGVLGVNSKGCITIGDAILVATDDSRLNSDGSIRVREKTYKLGEAVTFGGGGGDTPRQSQNRCGGDNRDGTDYFWVG